MNRRDFIKASLLVVPALALKVKGTEVFSGWDVAEGEREVTGYKNLFLKTPEGNICLTEGEGVSISEWKMESTPTEPNRYYEIIQRGAIYSSDVDENGNSTWEFVRFHEGGVTVDWSEKLDATS